MCIKRERERVCVEKERKKDRECKEIEKDCVQIDKEIECLCQCVCKEKDRWREGVCREVTALLHLCYTFVTLFISSLLCILWHFVRFSFSGILSRYRLSQ